MPAARRLAAILAADVAGYSRLMGADEEGTHARLQAHRRELINPKIGEHRGRIVKTTGDGLLVEFPSVVDAIRCAVEVQRTMIDRDAGLPVDRRIRFRIGINLGDVIVEDGDIFGDGVNVAARLEALADPGGLCISRVVRDQIRDKLPYPFEDLGEQSVKNIARPVRVYALHREAVADLRVASVPAFPPIFQPAPAPRLSIVVLPFANLSNDPDQQYFADGITEDLTTDLSRLADMLVISRNTAFTYQGKRVDTKQIGRELNVRYVLEGSVRRSGNQVRVNAQLIDAGSDTHLWADRLDADTGDLFALQDEITSRIAIRLNLELVRAEAGRATQLPEALDYILRARAAFAKPRSPAVFAEAISLFERALALDPQSVDAQSYLASTLAIRVHTSARLLTTPSGSSGSCGTQQEKPNGLTRSPMPPIGEMMLSEAAPIADLAAADLARAEVLAGQALAAAPLSPLAHFAKGQVLRAQRRFDEALPECETALASNRNWVSALQAVADTKRYTGSIEDCIPLLERAIRLSPRDPDLGLWYLNIGMVHLLQSRTDEAVVWLERARSAVPEHRPLHPWLASAYALTGETERAAAELAEARRLFGDNRYSSIARLRTIGSFGVPKIRALYESTYFAGLRLAGVPEE